MNDKNLALMDKIINAITGDGQGEWNEVLMNDPAIIAANNHFEALLGKVETLLPDSIYGELSDAYSGGLAAVGEAGILFGLHVADAIRDVSSRPADLSRHIMKRVERRETL